MTVCLYWAENSEGHLWMCSFHLNILESGPFLMIQYCITIYIYIFILLKILGIISINFSRPANHILTLWCINYWINIWKKNTSMFRNNIIIPRQQIWSYIFKLCIIREYFTHLTTAIKLSCRYCRYIVHHKLKTQYKEEFIIKVIIYPALNY